MAPFIEPLNYLVAHVPRRLGRQDHSDAHLVFLNTIASRKCGPTRHSDPALSDIDNRAGAKDVLHYDGFGKFLNKCHSHNDTPSPDADLNVSTATGYIGKGSYGNLQYVVIAAKFIIFSCGIVPFRELLASVVRHFNRSLWATGHVLVPGLATRNVGVPFWRNNCCSRAISTSIHALSMVIPLLQHGHCGRNLSIRTVINRSTSASQFGQMAEMTLPSSIVASPESARIKPSSFQRNKRLPVIVGEPRRAAA